VFCEVSFQLKSKVKVKVEDVHLQQFTTLSISRMEYTDEFLILFLAIRS